MPADLNSKCRDFLKRRGVPLLATRTNRLEELVQPLVQVLADEQNEHLLEEAARYLGMIGPAAEPSIKPLMAIIRNNPITPTTDEIACKLNRKMPWSYGWAARAAMDALKQIAPNKAIDEVGMLCLDSDPQVRFRAASALETIGEPADKVISHLLELLRDPESEIRRAAVFGLSPYPVLGEEPLNALLAVTKDQDTIVRLCADYLLVRKLSEYQQQYPEGISDFVDLLHHFAKLSDTGDRTSFDVLRAIPMMGSDSHRFVNRIMDLLRSKVPVTISGLAAINSALQEVVGHYPSLADLVQSSLVEIAVPDNEEARIVYNLYVNDPFPAGT